VRPAASFLDNREPPFVCLHRVSTATARIAAPPRIDRRVNFLGMKKLPAIWLGRL
jgi:hypothetical protein